MACLLQVKICLFRSYNGQKYLMRMEYLNHDKILCPIYSQEEYFMFLIPSRSFNVRH
ncbi:hypothetical protein EMU01_03810 [Enterococcus mundtii]|uniref:Transposase n=1 Tax=Enterococcus mundtii TaxID=53346 RepID=A0ABQ0V9R9_ENTMU|nr:hypothetical protein EMU01_03810 [Enterococcus mundtii]